MNKLEGIEERAHERVRISEAPRPRAVGSPLPAGNGTRTAMPPPASPSEADAEPPDPMPGAIAAPMPGPAPAQMRTLPSPPQDADDDPAPLPSNLQRALGGLRAALPYVHKILPLLDGQVITTVANLLAPRPVPPAPVNLAPLEGGMVELQTRHRELREQVAEQNASLKRVEDGLDMVREATDRNTLEQQELLVDLKKVSRSVTIFAVTMFVLLAASIAANVILSLHPRWLFR
jgi:hypothetical protein